jgi:hypothetical protein
MPAADQYTQTSEGSDETERVVDEEAVEIEIGRIDVCSD